VPACRQTPRDVSPGHPERSRTSPVASRSPARGSKSGSSGPAGCGGRTWAFLARILSCRRRRDVADSSPSLLTSSAIR